MALLFTPKIHCPYFGKKKKKKDVKIESTMLSQNM